MTQDEEAEANLFAMLLLMPEDILRKEVRKLGGVEKIDFERGKEIKILANKFQVSEPIMAARLIQVYKPRSFI